MSHTTLPEFLSRHSVRSDWSFDSSPAGTAVVTKIWLPTMIGDDQPLPEIGVFQATFFSADHSMGSLLSVA